MKIKKLILIAMAAAGLFSASAVTADSSGCRPGYWTSDFAKAKAYAESTGTPMLMFWGAESCTYCDKMIRNGLNQQAFIDWVKEHPIVLVFVHVRDTSSTAAKTFASCNKSGDWPYMRCYWKKKTGQTVSQCFTGRLNKMPATGRTTVEQLINTLNMYFGSWSPEPAYAGGSVAITETTGNRLEAEEGTSEISFAMTRSSTAAKSAATNSVQVVGPDGETAQTVQVKWTAGQTTQQVTVDVSGVNFQKDGDKARLIVKDANGKAKSTNTVTYVTGNSASNPLWIGERTATGSGEGATGASLMATGKPALAFGEWTMDLDVAKEKVAAATGDAYTLVAIEGSLWCHDCANTDRNFVNVKDGDGNNRLAAWAAANQVALVAIDIPNFTNNSVSCESPTLLSRKAYKTQLAKEGSVTSGGKTYTYYDVSKGGAPKSLTNYVARSGLGYLTRKGVSDEDAAVVLDRNWELVTKNTAEGGFHRPEDGNKFRTGVPIFVLLRKDGTVAARLTRFAAVSPMADLDWDSAIKRFDEMLEIASLKGGHSDVTEIENNDASTTTLSFKANGGSAEGEISHCDFQDIFKLEGVGGNALQKVTVTGAVDAVVSVSFVKLNDKGEKVVVGNAKTGKLSAGVSLEETFTSAGDYFVEVSGGDIANGDFAVDSAKDDNFAKFTISGAVVLVPQEGRATGSASADQDKVVMRFEKDQQYRIDGVDAEASAAILAPTDKEKFYTALVDGDAEVTIAEKGGQVTYQKWVPCKVGFTAASRKVTESVGDVKVALARTEGSSGAVTVRVSLDETKTTLYTGEGEPRFTFVPGEFTWADDKKGSTNIVIKVNDDTCFDGNGDVALKLELVSDENGDTVLGTTNFVLTVTEDDKQAAGKVAFTSADPFFSKKTTVYAKESEGATVYAERIEASDGYVTARVKVSSQDVSLEVDGKATDRLVWANRKFLPQAVKVTGLAAGKTTTLTLEGATGGLGILTTSNKVTVVSVADDAPEFEQAEASETLYRYVAVSKSYPVVLAAGAKGAQLTFTKLSGTLPSGLKATASGQALLISGVVTAKPGLYPVVYQVAQQVGSKKTPGLTINVTLLVKDPTARTSGGAYNAAVAAQASSLTIKDIPVMDTGSGRLAGLLKVTIPKTGKVSAKYTCSEGTVSFSAKGWSMFNAEDKALAAQFVTSAKGYSLELTVANNGSITANLTDPKAGAGDLVATHNGNVWSKTNNANKWNGYYTVALVSDHSSIKEAGGYEEKVAPRGNGYLALKLNTSSAINSGTVTWAGMLPNGTKVSGSAVLNTDDDCATNVELPVYKRSTKDVLALVIDMCETAVEASDFKAYWQHTERQAALSYEMELDIYGGKYNPAANLATASRNGYGSTSLKLNIDVAALGGSTFYGAPRAVAAPAVTIGASAFSVAKGNAAQASLSLAKTTGIVSGSFKLPCQSGGVTKSVKATFKGVVLLGWGGAGCGCGDEPEGAALPFVIGGYYFSDKVDVTSGGTTSAVTIKRGSTVVIDK